MIFQILSKKFCYTLYDERSGFSIRPAQACRLRRNGLVPRAAAPLARRVGQPGQQLFVFWSTRMICQPY